MKLSLKKQFISLTICLFCLSFSLEGANTVRAALDIGSGATKLRVAEVDLQKGNIEQVLETQSFSVPYQEELSKSKDGNFTQEVMDKGIQTLKDSVEIAQKHGAEKVIAVATAAFRKANNSDAFIKRIFDETGIQVHIIDQSLEGELAFKAVQSQFKVKPSDLVVWDIGGGSLQLTTADDQGKLVIYRGTEASTPFKNYVIEKIQKQTISQVETPNPMNVKEIMQAGFHAQKLAEKVDRFIKDKLNNPRTVTIGVGNIFGYQISGMFNKQKEFTREGLVDLAAKLANKSDKDVGGGDYANVFITNTLLILGFMEGLDIKKMQITDINPADGAFFHAPFWGNQGSEVASSISAKVCCLH
jgi:exopolyphosphatase/guanosine-5'-triphosphate,3'-diphosphate pyrophosphatase